MKRIILVMVLLVPLSLGASAQIGGLSFPGPGPNVTSGTNSCVSGSNMTGVFDLTNTCNDIYLLTGVI
jgi:hypothetical protein